MSWNLENEEDSEKLYVSPEEPGLERKLLRKVMGDGMKMMKS